MEKEKLIKYKEILSRLSKEENKQRDLQYLRKLATGEMEGPSIGYASLDKPWLRFYPEEMYYERKKYNKIIDYILDTWSKSLDDTMIHYYGKDITAKEFFDNVTNVAKSLKTLGLNKGDTIVVDLEGVPEFIYLFFASEMIGVNVKNKIGADVSETIDVINSSNAKYFFVHDYISDSNVQDIYENTVVKNVIVINPVEHIGKDLTFLRPHIKECISKKYIGKTSEDEKNINWNSFISLGKNYSGEIYEKSDLDTKLFSAYTSGSTGARKEVIHSSKTFLEMLDQMIFSIYSSDNRETWLWPSLPPSLVAIVLAYMCMPLAQGRKVILDPYFDYKDIDLEMMHYEPNSTGLVSVFLESFIDSKRIPNDYDMSYLKVLGFGAEAIPKKNVIKIDKFLKQHNCLAPLNGGYGLSEGGSQVAIAFNNDVLLGGSTGIPLINTIISIFEPNTKDELKYGSIGEICKAGSGIMLGYATDEETSKVVKVHSDGMKWLHTGDFGYMNEDGFLFVLGREKIELFNGMNVYPLELENRITDIEGVKNAIIVSGNSKIHERFQTIYLFIVPEENVNLELSDIKEKLKSVLLEEELPEEIHIIPSKPISHFKVNRKVLRRDFNISTNK